MDLTGSIYDFTAPISVEVLGSATGAVTGSSAIDTILNLTVSFPSALGSIAAMAGADLGSTWGT